MISVLAIDPGSEKSGVVLIEGRTVREHSVVDNESLLEQILAYAVDEVAEYCAIEYTPPYTMTTRDGRAYVPEQLLTTTAWIGRFEQCWHLMRAEWPARIKRRDALKYVTGKGSRVGDTQVRQCLIERFGGTKEKAIGLKTSPGPLYGITSHEWAALAVAVTFQSQRQAAF